MALVVDTGVLLAALDVRDRSHAACAHLLRGSRDRAVIPAATLPEIDYLLALRVGGHAFLELLAEIRIGVWRVEELATEDYGRVLELCRTYADLDLGFVDAAVMAIVERLGEPKLATLDRRHFTVVRPRHVAALELLPTSG